jgi:hypothetical protein
VITAARGKRDARGIRKRILAGVLLAVAVFPGMGLGAAWADDIPQVQCDATTAGCKEPLTLSVGVLEPLPDLAGQVQVPTGLSPAQTQVLVTFVGFKPYSYVEIYVNSTPILVASGFANANGEFATPANLPAGLPVGEHTITATGTKADGTAVKNLVIRKFTVTMARTVETAESIQTTTLRRAQEAAAQAAVQQATSSTPTPSATGTQTTITDQAQANAALGPDPYKLGNVLYVSGVSREALPSVSPTGGSVRVSMTVRNVSAETFDSSLTFSLSPALNIETAGSGALTVAALKPGETRTIAAEITDVGQWPVLEARAQLVPPPKVANTELAPLERNAYLFVWPLFTLALLVVAFMLYLLWRYLPIFQRFRSGGDGNQ